LRKALGILSDGIKFIITRILKIKQRKMMLMKRDLKILLVNLPWQRGGKSGVRAGSRWPHVKDESEGGYLPFPFFLAYAASLLQKHSFQALIVDAIAQQIPEDVFIKNILPMDLDYLVAETSIPSFYYDLKILEKIAKSGISIILCGPNALIYDPKFLEKHPFISFILYGEYEFTLLDLARCLQEGESPSNVRGLIYRDKNSVVKNPERHPFDVNLLPWPDRGNLPMEKYLDAPGEMPTPSVQVLASRGCPFGCNFCLWPQVIYRGNHYRARDVHDVIDEMEYLIRERNFKSVYFDDDTWNIGKARILRFCNEIKKRDLQSTPWAIMARPDLMDEKILTELKSAGLWAVKYGVESCVQSLVENSHKNMKLKNSFQMIKLTKNLGIKVHLTFCFGLQGETRKTIQKSIGRALSLEPDSVQFSILTPFPGTRLFEELDRQGRILTKDWSKYDGHYHCVFRPDNLDHHDLEKAKIHAYKLWAKHIRKKRGLKGEISRLYFYIRNEGLIRASARVTRKLLRDNF
jgi:anaerobic magnesium-protoporphyrin IX monomethyl ester cyclase